MGTDLISSIGDQPSSIVDRPSSIVSELETESREQKTIRSADE
jgi:hypothetical protein